MIGVIGFVFILISYFFWRKKYKTHIELLRLRKLGDKSTWTNLKYLDYPASKGWVGEMTQVYMPFFIPKIQPSDENQRKLKIKVVTFGMLSTLLALIGWFLLFNQALQT